MRRVLGEAHPDTLRGMSNVATVYQQQGKQAQAEPLYTNILDIQRRVLGEGHPDTLTSMSNLALTYVSQQKYAEAEPLLLSAYQGMLQRQATIPTDNRPALREAGQRIVQLYQSWSKPEKAAEWIMTLQRANLWSAQ